MNKEAKVQRAFREMLISLVGAACSIRLGSEEKLDCIQGVSQTMTPWKVQHRMCLRAQSMMHDHQSLEV